MKTNPQRTYQLPSALYHASIAIASLTGAAGALLSGVAGAICGIVLAVLASVAFVAIRDSLKRNAAARPSSPDDTKSTINASPDRIDELTQLANLNGLNAWFAERRGRLEEDNKAIVVLTADLTGFDQLVQSRGREQADSIIKETAKRVSSLTGKDGIAARIDGDEFAAIATVAPDESLEYAAEQAGKLAEMLQRPVELSIGVIWIGGSVGAATGKPKDSAEIFERSRNALKRAKKMGRGQYYVDGLETKST
jgi:diguanylate cyclase (GGDEF)-like protein